jgi:hypothetical protein
LRIYEGPEAQPQGLFSFSLRPPFLFEPYGSNPSLRYCLAIYQLSW